MNAVGSPVAYQLHSIALRDERLTQVAVKTVPTHLARVQLEDREEGDHVEESLERK